MLIDKVLNIGDGALGTINRLLSEITPVAAASWLGGDDDLAASLLDVDEGSKMGSYASDGALSCDSGAACSSGECECGAACDLGRS